MQIPGKSYIIPRKLVSIRSPSGFQKVFVPPFILSILIFPQPWNGTSCCIRLNQHASPPKQIGISKSAICQYLEYWTWVTQVIGMGPSIYQILSKMITNNYQALLESLTTGILITIQPSQQTINETTRDENTYSATPQIWWILEKAGNKIYCFWRHSLVEDLQHNRCDKNSIGNIKE